MELRDYIRILHRNWVLILVLTILGGAGGFGYAATQTPQYQSTTRLYVSVQADSADPATGDLVQGTTFARQIVASYVDVVTSALVLQPVIDDLNLDTSVGSLASQVTAEAPLNTVNINITVTSTSGAQSAKLADAIASSLVDAVQTTLEPPVSEGAASPVRLTVVQPAVEPSTPFSPRIPVIVVVAALFGLVVAVLLSILRNALDTRVRTLKDLESLTEAPLLGGIAFDPEATKRPLIVQEDPRSPRSESFRALRTNLQFLNVEGGPKLFVVTSSGPGEGKSTTTANLAIALAETGARVALLDGDLRLPRIADYMGIEGGVGLTDVLIGRVEVADVLQKWGRGQLFVLPSGPVPPNPAELLGSAAMSQLLATLTEHFDYVLIDAPPLLLVTDAAVLSKVTRGAIMVAASGKAKKQEFEGALRTLQTAGGRLVGVIMTMLPTRGPDSYGYGAYSYGGDAETGSSSGSSSKRSGKRASSRPKKKRKVSAK
ncbi:polysaccharide biosynthesis tyrosine autokinase [Microbacterium sp. KSW2-21]|uniref:Polysaccharide biosynthesis tyrosine autokinase n=1 Tax=Microbacterium algihabitans TaxID=3075992 RepID=A0ABU3RT46_9MICO|nr:polysaccharide biosynthesis tyrosine autokinase [Microbacterium sp. KSW2-21]MDU0325775.1 polysaccharide biosynthesis tyrosine autokinase [Microbacterium sp. KSW2-21]